MKTIQNQLCVSEVETELKQERRAVFYVHQLCFEASAIEEK